MGCAASRYIIQDPSRPVFHVWNVDEQGEYVKSCHLQVTATDLVLHQRGESPILWPLQCLRRYGFDSDLFSFECGKRCITGPGIYAFKCKNAASLFNQLQESMQVFSESELGLSSVTGPENGSSIIRHDSEETLNGTSHIGDSGQDGLLDYGVDSQPSTSTGIKKIHPLRPERTVPTAPEETIESESTPSLIPRSCFRESRAVAPKVTGHPPFLYQKLYKLPGRTLPRCCTIATCINASNQHYMNKKALRNTTCGSCRTCSLNMCVVRPSVSYAAATDSEERARQADYGNVLDPGGHPRQCVHCCCDFKPSKQMSSCSADDCPLHFNNCVDQITNYARLDEHLKQRYSSGARYRKSRIPQQQPVNFPSYAHLYTNIPTPTKKWPLPEHSKTSSWRSLPHFQTTMSFLGKLAPKRSVSHFYSDMENYNFDKETKIVHKDFSPKKSSECKSSTKLGLEKPHESSFFVSPSAPVVCESPKAATEPNGKESISSGELEKKLIISESFDCKLLNGSD